MTLNKTFNNFIACWKFQGNDYFKQSILYTHNKCAILEVWFCQRYKKWQFYYLLQPQISIKCASPVKHKSKSCCLYIGEIGSEISFTRASTCFCWNRLVFTEQSLVVKLSNCQVWRSSEAPGPTTVGAGSGRAGCVYVSVGAGGPWTWPQAISWSKVGRILAHGNYRSRPNRADRYRRSSDDHELMDVVDLNSAEGEGLTLFLGWEPEA